MGRLPPSRRLPDRDDAGAADLDRLSELLEQLADRGRIERRLDVYVTEFGYETDPPDRRRGVSLGRQAAYLTQAAALAMRRPDVRMHAQFLLRDVPERWLYQTGLLRADGRPKPSLGDFPLPFLVAGRAARGQVRPGEGPQRVLIERHRGDGSWTPATEEFETDGSGTFARVLGRPGTYRLRWMPRSGPSRVSTPSGP
jgi:hypothetical protein